MIKIIGLGPGAIESLTLGTINELKNGKNVFFRTEKHPTIDYIKTLNIEYKTLDHFYNELDSFDQVYEAISNEIINEYRNTKELIYGVPGHPLVAERSVSMLIEKCEEMNIDYEIVPAVSFIDAMMEALKIDPIKGMKILDAFDIGNSVLDKRVGIILTQVYDKYIASDVKLKLAEYYGDDYEVYFVRAAGVKGLEVIKKIKIYEIDRMEDIDYLTSLYIPSTTEVIYDFNDLTEIMDELRGEEGCQWDKKQTHESLKKYLIEECYEVIDAIDKDDIDKMIEEFGDVLLQVVFHAQIGKEEGYFNINDIIKSICEKMVRRHPHIFNKKAYLTESEVLTNWEDIKKQEKGFHKHSEGLEDIPKALPSLMRAEKIQKKAAKVGFDWNDINPAMDKVIEELNEIKDVYKTNNRSKILDEIGDLIFACVNVARFLNINSEEALNSTCDKFIRRFSYIEEQSNKKGFKLEDMSLEEMDVLWEEAKCEE
ncbi:nucleoside triphosphate pyrophosphohydrolase [Oceanirhabdus sp. W0125-5]|uniref:nucleoside triphosphate pyrophosphohydrolase n=1 Tax=Oceanirhabdus sp. W0125-5 TaxID=2999116 RepID=UPI0022F32F4B|nr:nucleoside triphosphate pyrophosphohydrolase [Oceanirhabdus sp. W0125-5]WBW97934.1 nucleoside triphosphate pyrophosphohydrolase [Oceanirhabdus sp. W0125-5]